MKRFLALACISGCLLLSACNAASIGIIGGADGPTDIYVTGQFGEQYEKKPIRMFNVDGELYYDTGLVSDVTPRCGTLDGELKRGAAEGEIPRKSGEANFDIDGYQNGTSITKEVGIDGDWVIFKKYKNVFSNGDGEWKYCFYIKGRLNSAAIDSELVVLTDNKDITFSDVFEPLLSSQLDAGKDNGLVSFNNIVSGDKWGVSLTADDITSRGMTVKFEQFGGKPTGSLQTGAWYKLEKTVDDEWQDVKPKQENPVWNSIAYGIKKNDITELEVNWEALYGELPPGFYRLSKEIMDFREAGDYDEEIYQVYFSVEE